jgi:hypothetical protein
MSGTPRPLGLCKLHSKNGLGQATGSNALVVASIPIAEYLEEDGYGAVLIVTGTAGGRAQEECREAAPGEASCDLGCMELRTADTSDPGTCKITTVW